MKLATYSPDSGQVQSETGTIYDCRLKTHEHLFIAVALSRLADGDCTLQEAYESISTNYDLHVVKFEEDFK